METIRRGGLLFLLAGDSFLDLGCHLIFSVPSECVIELAPGLWRDLT